MDWHKLLLLGEDFIGNDDVCLVLGDNIFYGSGFSGMLKNASKNISKGKSTVLDIMLRTLSDLVLPNLIIKEM